MDIVHGALIVSALKKHNCTRAQARSSGVRIEQESCFTLARGLLQQARVAEHTAQGVVGVGTVGAPAHEICGFLESLGQFSPFNVSHGEVCARSNVIGIQRQSPCSGGLVAFHHSVPATAIATLEIVPSAKNQPRGSEVRIESY